MQDHTPTPYFPDNIEDYAPWVSKHGLRYPYGECQCGCGQKTRIAPYDYAPRQWRKGEPGRFFSSHNYRKTFAERFWGMADTSGGPDACWHWKGFVHPNGYGQLPPTLAHRASWEIHNGPIPEGLQILHKCDNRKCVNPKHLFLGTQLDNMHDMINKGRAVRVPMLGEKNPRAKINKQIVHLIREKSDSGMKPGPIAKELGISVNAVRGVVKGASWKHV